MTDDQGNSPIYLPKQPSDNPAWNSALEGIPEEFHGKLKDEFSRWDSGVNDRFNKIHEEYAPWKEYTKQGYDAETINFALGVVDKLDKEPQFVYNQLETYLKEKGLLQGQESGTEDNEAVEYDDPRIGELYEGFTTLAELTLKDKEEKQHAEQDAILDRELHLAAEKYGQFDEEYVLSKIEAGMDTEEAVQAYHTFVNSLLTNRNRPPAPRLIGSAGAFPGQQQVDPKTLDGAQRKALVTDILNSMKD